MNVLVIGDLHLPFVHRHYLAFCKETQKKYKCKKVVQIGDVVDNHALSYFDHDPDGWSPKDEMAKADKELKKWFKAFPSVSLCLGNHDRLVDRKGKTHGLPSRAFRAFRDIWNLPEAWQESFEHEIEGVLYKHGEGYSGKMPHMAAAEAERMNVVIGHIHTVAAFGWTASERDCIFGMAVGCGIDRHTYAFQYGRSFKKKPILAAGVVYDGQDGQVIRMKL